jgi:hypothetical protein
LRPPPASAVQGIGDLVEAVVEEAVVEEVVVQVQRHRGGLVAKHLPDDLHVGTGRDREACRSVAQDVRH